MGRAGHVRFANAQSQVLQSYIAVDKVVTKAVGIGKVVVAIEVNKWFTGPFLCWHGCVHLVSVLCVALNAIAANFIHWMIGVMLAAAMRCAAKSGKVFVFTEESAVRRNPTCYGLNAGRFRRVVHDDLLSFRHDFVLAAIAADFEGGGSYRVRGFDLVGVLVE